MRQALYKYRVSLFLRTKLNIRSMFSFYGSSNLYFEPSSSLCYKPDFDQYFDKMQDVGFDDSPSVTCRVDMRKSYLWNRQKFSPKRLFFFSSCCYFPQDHIEFSVWNAITSFSNVAHKSLLYFILNLFQRGVEVRNVVKIRHPTFLKLLCVQFSYIKNQLYGKIKT